MTSCNNCSHNAQRDSEIPRVHGTGSRKATEDTGSGVIFRKGLGGRQTVFTVYEKHCAVWHPFAALSLYSPIQALEQTLTVHVHVADDKQNGRPS